MDDAVVLRGAGGLQLDCHLIVLFGEPCQGLFVLFGGDLFMGQISSPPSGDQEEDVVGHSLQLDRQMKDILYLLQISLGHRGIDLEIKACLFEICDPFHGPCIGTDHTAKSIVALWSGAIQADAHPLDAGFLGRCRLLGI